MDGNRRAVTPRWPTVKVGVVGASGYAGVELLRICAAHPDLEVVVATAGSHAGASVGVHTPSLVAAYPNLTYVATEASELDGLDLVFVALPHGQSQHLIPALESEVGVIVDLAADFRLRDPALYPIWYGEPHTAPALLGRFVYGLPELHRQELSGARLIAAPGCYPTAAILALAPLIEAGALAVAGPGPTPAGQPPAPSLIVMVEPPAEPLIVNPGVPAGSALATDALTPFERNALP